MFVEILLPSKGKHKYLRVALESLSNQTFKNFKVLIIDNSETDECRNYIRKLASLDERFYVLNFVQKGEKAATLGEILNFGLSHCGASIVARQDDDDISHPIRIEKQIRVLDSAEICGTQGSFYDRNGRYLYASNLPVRNKDMREYMFWANPIIHTSVMFKRDAIERIGPYDETLVNGQDLELWSRAEVNGITIENVNKYLVGVRLRDDGITGSTIALKSRVQVSDISRLHSRVSQSRTTKRKWFLFTYLPNSKVKITKRLREGVKSPGLSLLFLIMTLQTEIRSRLVFRCHFATLLRRFSSDELLEKNSVANL